MGTRYAKFLAERGFEVITHDYRGIGESRPEDLRRCRFRWQPEGVFQCDPIPAGEVSNPIFNVAETVGYNWFGGTRQTQKDFVLDGNTIDKLPECPVAWPFTRWRN
jgi:hypothetical protein